MSTKENKCFGNHEGPDPILAAARKWSEETGFNYTCYWDEDHTGTPTRYWLFFCDGRMEIHNTPVSDGEVLGMFSYEGQSDIDITRMNCFFDESSMNEYHQECFENMMEQRDSDEEIAKETVTPQVI